MPTPFKLCPSRFRLFSVIFQCFLQVENLLAVVDDAVRDVACDGTRHVAVRHVAAWHVAARRETQCVTGMTRHSFLAISAHMGFRFFNSHEKQKNKIMHCIFVYPVCVCTFGSHTVNNRLKLWPVAKEWLDCVDCGHSYIN